MTKAERSMRDFTYTANPSRVLFGPGRRADLPAEVERLGLERVIILSTASRQTEAQSGANMLGRRVAGMFAGAVMHTPIGVTEQALRQVKEARVDGIIACGGGSTIGLGKAIALRTDLPQIVIPTTYAGSEMTPIIGETVDGRKATQTTAKVLPEVVIYDVELTLDLPPKLSVTSGINAIAHAVEALYAQNRNPIVSLLAVEGIGAMARALPRIAVNPTSLEARSDALYGAWLCGTCLGAVGMALHHKLCHTLGGAFNLPHAETHLAILPHALAYNAPAVPYAIRSLADALGHPDPARALFDLAGGSGAPRSLELLGMPENGIDLAADLTLANPYWNPRPLDREGIRALIARAWAGEPPASN